MGTNYYARGPHHTPDQEGLHIGKNSAGWEFLWRAHPDMDITSTEAWYQFLAHPWVTITAEHGRVLSLSEFWEFAGKRPAVVEGVPVMRHGGFLEYGVSDDGRFRDKLGYPFAVGEFS